MSDALKKSTLKRNIRLENFIKNISLAFSVYAYLGYNFTVVFLIAQSYCIFLRSYYLFCAWKYISFLMWNCSVYCFIPTVPHFLKYNSNITVQIELLIFSLLLWQSAFYYECFANDKSIRKGWARSKPL